MNRLILDVESTIRDDGNPYNSNNRLCCVGLYSPPSDLGIKLCVPIEYDNRPYGNQLSAIKELIEAADLLIGFNLKFDINWIRKYIPDIVFPDVWDCQLAEFILAAQRKPYPSLGDTAISYGVGEKLSSMSEDYWDKGIDTPDIPWDILEKYNLNDLEITNSVYDKQNELLTGNQRKLFQLQCADLLILSEMESNGLLIDTETLERRSVELDIKIKEIYNELNAIVGRDDINWDSPTQLSIILYGGELRLPCKETVTRVLKSGKIKTYERMGTQSVTCLPRVQFLPNTETVRTKDFNTDDLLNKENEIRKNLGKPTLQRIYETNEPTLRALRPRDPDTRRIIQSLLTLGELSQLQSTYYRGLLSRIKESMGDPSTSRDSNSTIISGPSCTTDASSETECGSSERCGSISNSEPLLRGERRGILGASRAIIHGQFNQCVAVTGRLSSSKPNLQNMAEDVLEAIKTRYVN